MIRRRLQKLFLFVRRWPVYLWFHSKRVDPLKWDSLYLDFRNDLLFGKRTTIRQKLWAYRRGFLSTKIGMYGLNQSNFTDYASDLGYYEKHMHVNRRFHFWFNDKVTTWFLLSPFHGYLPEHYFLIENKKILHFCGVDGYSDDVDGIIGLLREKKALALKQTKGSNSTGFYRIEYRDQSFWRNGEPITEQDFRSFILTLDKYLITEFLEPHEKLKKFSMVAPSVMRLSTIFDRKEGVQLVGSYLKFETRSDSFYTSDYGTVYAGLRLDDGVLFDPHISKVEKGGVVYIPCENHPGTGDRIEGSVPDWHNIIEICSVIGAYLSCTPFLTYDIVPTNNGFKILEINQHGMQWGMQLFYPLFRNKYAIKLFVKNTR